MRLRTCSLSICSRSERASSSTDERSGSCSVRAISFVVILVAELGDKSQLMALTFATRFRALPVLIGITAATAVVHAVSVGVGYLLGARR